MEESTIDVFSFQLGMINCFVEMVAVGVKELALSPPLLPNDYNLVKPYSDKIIAGFEIKSYTDDSLLVTMLQTEDFTKGKKTILYFRKEETLNKYLALKTEKEKLLSEKRWTAEADRRLSEKFMRLLSYPEELIEEKINGKTKSPYMLINE